MAKRGRPSKYKREFAGQARKLCLLGATNPELAQFFEVTVSTIDKWISEIPEFSGAVKAGRKIADADVSESLYRRANGYTHDSEEVFVYRGKAIRVKTVKYYPPDATSMIFWLKNRRPDLWRDKPVGDTGDDRLDEVLDLIRNGPTETKPFTAGAETEAVREEDS